MLFLGLSRGGFLVAVVCQVADMAVTRVAILGPCGSDVDVASAMTAFPHFHELNGLAGTDDDAQGRDNMTAALRCRICRYLWLLQTTIATTITASVAVFDLC